MTKQSQAAETQGPELDNIESTLYVPLQGRIYASENFPKIFYDKKALELKDKLPKNFKGKDQQTQYSYMAGAIRSVIFDKFIDEFLREHPDGVIAQLGCGLETTYFRHEDKGVWYSIDLPEIISYRKKILPAGKNETLVIDDILDYEWLDQIKMEHPGKPLLVTASGLFYYFDHYDVIRLFRKLQKRGNTSVLFDAISPLGIKFTSVYMKRMGHGDAKLRFSAGNMRKLTDEIGGEVKFGMNFDRYYSHTDKTGMNFNTKFNMWGNDLFRMTKVVALEF